MLWLKNIPIGEVNNVHSSSWVPKAHPEIVLKFALRTIELIGLPYSKSTGEKLLTRMWGRPFQKASLESLYPVVTGAFPQSHRWFPLLLSPSPVPSCAVRTQVRTSGGSEMLDTQLRNHPSPSSSYEGL